MCKLSFSKLCASSALCRLNFMQVSALCRRKPCAGSALCKLQPYAVGAWQVQFISEEKDPHQSTARFQLCLLVKLWQPSAGSWSSSASWSSSGRLVQIGAFPATCHCFNGKSLGHMTEGFISYSSWQRKHRGQLLYVFLAALLFAAAPLSNNFLRLSSNQLLPNSCYCSEKNTTCAICCCIWY